MKYEETNGVVADVAPAPNPQPGVYFLLQEGEVVYVGWLRGYGNLVVIRHGGEYFSLYGYLDETFIRQGNNIGEGEPLGLSGDSGSLYGPALHFEIRHGRDPLDPVDWLAN